VNIIILISFNKKRNGKPNIKKKENNILNINSTTDNSEGINLK